MTLPNSRGGRAQVSVTMVQPLSVAKQIATSATVTIKATAATMKLRHSAYSSSINDELQLCLPLLLCRDLQPADS